MPGDRNARSSDIAQARELSQRLRRSADPAAVEPFSFDPEAEGSREPRAEPGPPRPPSPRRASAPDGFRDGGTWSFEPDIASIDAEFPELDGPLRGAAGWEERPLPDLLEDAAQTEDETCAEDPRDRAAGGGRELRHLAGLAAPGWRERLRAVLAIADDEGAQAEAAFAVDAQGLMLAQLGEIDDDAVEEAASRLSILTGQAARMEGFTKTPPRAILIEFDSGWLTALRIEETGASPLFVGVATRRPLTPATRAAVSERISETLRRLGSG